MEDDIDPFLETTTIASACQLLFRKKFLKPETIGVMNACGYNFRDNQSHVALVWLKWEEEWRTIRIEHAANGYEVVVGGMYKVDGFHGESNTVLEFQGCA